ncbi:MAG TPA: YceI family protein [Acetobacteraceae bacterium]|nr:YceI family protein [Acetobacteraceae bacterium]
MRYAALFGILALLLPRHGVAADASVALAPGHATVAFRAYGLGLLPLDGRFARFRGRFSYDPDDHARCTVALRVDVAGLAMAPATVGAMVLGPDFLDAARFPALAYDGACDAGGLTGRLTMHGVTRPFGLTLDWGKDGVTAVGRLRRADWGMTARPLLVGSTVRITVTMAAGQERGGGR